MMPRTSNGPRRHTDAAGQSIHTQNRFFEQLEERALLSVPTVAMEPTTMRATEWLLLVRYRGVDGIDLSTIGNGDIRVSSPAQAWPHLQPVYNELGRLWEAPRPQPDGSVLAVYTVPARGGVWDFSDTGQYAVWMERAQVRDNTGDAVRHGFLRGYALWFTNPQAKLGPSFMTGSHWTFSVEYRDDQAIDATSLGYGDVEVVAPGGLVATAFADAILNPVDGVTKVFYRAKVAQGNASFKDSGVYSVRSGAFQVSDINGAFLGAHTLGSSPYWSDAPVAELVSSEQRPTDWIISVRYSDRFGISLPSIGNGDLQVRLGALGSSVASASLVTAPRVDPDGSVVATYLFRAPSGGWSPVEGAYSVVLGVDQVRNTAGLRITTGRMIQVDEYSASSPLATVTQSRFLNPRTWEVSVRFTDADGLVESTFINADGLMLYGPGSYRSLLTTQSATQENPTTWNVTYTVTAAGPSFASGRYYLRSTPFGVWDSAGHTMPQLQLTAFGA